MMVPWLGLAWIHGLEVVEDILFLETSYNISMLKRSGLSHTLQIHKTQAFFHKYGNLLVYLIYPLDGTRNGRIIYLC